MINSTCLCADHYFSQNGLQICLSCDITCLTCSNSLANGCLSCDGTYFRQLSLLNTCVCISGYYQTSPLIELCSICQYSCQTCTTSSTCATCNALQYRVMNVSNSLCTCMNQYYDNGNELCLACSYFCLTCTTNIICSTCDSLTRNVTNLTVCSCLNGFYDNGISSSCLSCLA